MSYLYTDEQIQIRDEVRKALAKTCGPEKARSFLETKAAYDQEFWELAGEMGWTGITISEDAGGLGMGIVDAMIVAEEAGRVLAAAPFLATGFAASHALAAAGDADAAIAALQGALAAGSKTCAIAFADNSETLPALPGPAISDGRLTGKKSAALGGASADMALVLAKIDGKPVLAVADLSSNTVSRTTLPTVDNSRCIADLAFDATPVTVLDLGDPVKTAAGCLERLALHLASEAVGGSDSCITMATDYANQRQAFGQVIGKFQAVKHAISEMYVANELARASVLDAAARMEKNQSSAMPYIAAARLNAVHSYEYAAAAATQVHGGIGVTWEADLHLHYRRSRSQATEAGPPAFWEDRIVAALEEVQ